MSNTATFCLKLDWKSFSVNLPKVEYWMKENAGPSYCGLQAHDWLEIWFISKPSDQVIEAINDYWSSLTANADEATKYYSNAKLKEAIAAAKADAVTKAYDALSVQQKKLLMGVALTESDNHALLKAFSA